MRILLMLVLLTGLPSAQTKPIKDMNAFELSDFLYMRALRVCLDYGNYSNAERLIVAIQKGIEPLLARPMKDPASIKAACASLESDQVIALALGNSYTEAIELGLKVMDTPEAAPETWLQAAFGSILAARAASRPELLDRVLPEFQTRAAGDPTYSFAARTFLTERQLERNPELDDAAVLQSCNEAWKLLKGFQPKRADGTQYDGVAFMAAERFWYAWLLERVLATGSEKWHRLLDVEETRVNDLINLAWLQHHRLEYPLGFHFIALDDIEAFAQAGEYAEARDTLDYDEREFIKPLFQKVKQKEVLHRKETARHVQLVKDEIWPTYKANGLTLDPSPLDYSLLEGSIYRIRARQLQLRARLMLDQGRDHLNPAQLQKVSKLLTEARELQRRAARGTFLGLDDVRWDMLRAGTADLKTADELLAESEKQSYRPGLIAAYGYQGQLLDAANRKPEAVAALAKAVDLAERYLAESGANQTGQARIRARYRSIYDRLARLQLDVGNHEDAYATLARRQQLLAIADSGNLSPEAATLRGQATALEQELASKRASGQDSKPVEELLAKTRGEYNTVVARLRQDNPRYASLLAVRPVSFSKQQQYIPADAAIVQYFPSGDALHIFVATREALRIRKVALTDEALDAQVRAFRAATLAKGPNPASERLHALLIDPLEADVATKAVLAFIPTGNLNYLPFGALSKNGKFLITRKQCVTLLKSADLDQLSQPANMRREGMLALGNPDGSLPAAAAEATDVATMFGSTAFLGVDATAARLGASGPVAYVHLATHGVLNPRDPAASYLVLASGRLPVERIYDLNLGGVRLVTLSACQTALGETSPGSELTTLADAFSAAGATAVIASLWSVDDRSTQELMTEFYGRLKGGENLAQSLQGAQVKLLTAGRPPFQWAPFVLIGDWR